MLGVGVVVDGGAVDGGGEEWWSRNYRHGGGGIIKSSGVETLNRSWKKKLHFAHDFHMQIIKVIGGRLSVVNAHNC